MVVIPSDVYQKRIIVVLISGKAGAGKTTVANFMLDGLPENKIAGIAPFAMGVKTVATLVGWNRQKDEKGRKFLQQIGNSGREYDKDTWIKFTMDSLQGAGIPFNFLFVDDWRFPNEYDWFTNKDAMYGVYKVRILRNEFLLLNPNDTDISETSLTDDANYYDFTINNKNIDLDELRAHSRLVLQNIIDKEYSLEKES